ncbi:MAG: 2-dehydropantoate 2-reductase [Burkholderiales bacterium]|nr:2-dehydropantoate 2-reductase [Burkholderiales bacterium]
MRILVVGAGSTGGYFGGKLAKAGADVTFLVRPRRAEALKQGGLQIVSPHGDFSIVPKLVSPGEIGEPHDLVILSVKAYSLDGAIEDMAPAIGDQTAIMPLLNGMRHLDVLKARFGEATLIGGLCKIASTLDAEGRVLQLSDFHDIVYGELNGETTARIEAIDAAMRAAGVGARLSGAILREMWEKWTFLATLAGTTCLMRGSVGEMVASPAGERFVEAFLAEVVSIVSAVGLAPTERFLAGARKMLTAQGSSLTSSMLRDLLQGNMIEADQIIGDLLVRGERAGIMAPLLNAAYANLAVYEGRGRNA